MELNCNKLSISVANKQVTLAKDCTLRHSANSARATEHLNSLPLQIMQHCTHMPQSARTNAMNQQKANIMTSRELQLLYSEGKNITQAMRENQGLKENTDEIIEMAYELQSGSYTKAMANRAFADSKDAYASELARTILSLGIPSSILEAGVGEATTMAGVLRHLPPEIPSYGFDLSWSRIAYAKHWLEKHGIANSTPCTGNLFDIPFADNSVDF